jgi:hypothetical protein
MERIGAESTRQPPHIRQVVFASFIGTAIEWYDFFRYGTTAALIFPKLFFPAFSPLAGTLASFATARVPSAGAKSENHCLWFVDPVLHSTEMVDG